MAEKSQQFSITSSWFSKVYRLNLFLLLPPPRNSIYCGGGGKKIIVMRDNLTVSILPETKVCLLRSFFLDFTAIASTYVTHLIDWQMPSDFHSSRHSSSESRHGKKSCENDEEVRWNVVCEKLWTRYRFRQSNRVCFRFFHHLTIQFNKTLFLFFWFTRCWSKLLTATCVRMFMETK